ncbi:Small G protein signaling modulator 1 [Bienertia sinuspersici]
MSNMNIEIKSEDEVVKIKSTGGVGVWNECIETYFIGLIEKKKDHSQDQVKNKYNQLRIEWKVCSKILEETRIGYNTMTYQLSVEDVV